MEPSAAPWPLRGALLLLSLIRPLVPARHRRRWLREWRAELWYAHRAGRGRLARSLSALPHATALRWQETRPEMALADIRYAVRQLRGSPGFALLVAVTLGLGIGANSLVYSVLQSTVLSPLDLPDAERIVYLWRSSPDSVMQVPPTLVEVDAWRDQVDGLEQVQPLAGANMTLTGHGEARRLHAGRTWPGFFDFVGVRLALGRPYTEEETVEGRDRVVVLGHRLWREAFAGDESILGREIILDDEPHVVIGVLPAGFRLQSPFSGVDVWAPLVQLPEGRGVTTMARLAPGVTAEAVNAELAGLAQDSASGSSAFSGWVGIARPPQGMVRGQYRTVLWSVQGAVLFVLLIAGANTANLLLARGSGHRRELAIRSALGAGRGRLVRQLLAESLLLSLAGGALGLAIAHVGVRVLAGLRPGDLSSFETLRLDPSVVWATLGLSLACGVLFGVLPAFQACRGRLAEDLAEGGRTGGDGARGNRLRSTLVVVEVALATLLLVGAGLLMHSFVRLQGIDPGFDADNVLTVQVALPEQRYDAAERQEFWRRLESGLRTALGPGIEEMTIASGVPPDIGVLFGTPETEEGPLEGDQRISASITGSSTYFRTLGIPFVEGGPYPDDAGEDERFAVINSAFAAKLWPDDGAVGHRLRFGDEGPWITITGVVPDIKTHGLDSSFTDQHVYMGDSWSSYASNQVALRSAGDPLELAAAVRAQIRQLEPDAVVDDFATVDERLGDSIALQRFNAQTMLGFAALAIVLAVVGIYGVLSYSVARRTGELGVRLALGASTAKVLKLVAREGLTLVAVGLALGLLAAAGLGRLLGSQLYGVEAVDPLTYALVAVIFPAIGVAATAIPAWRATRVDPVIALRAD